MRRWSTSGLLGIVVLGVVAAASLFLWQVHQRSRARGLLRAVMSLPLGVATLSNAQSLGDEYGAARWSATRSNPTCSAHDCDLTFVFENKLLSKLPRDRQVSFTVNLIIKDDHLVSKQIEYGLGSTTVAQFAYEISDHLTSSLPGQEVKKFWTDGQGTMSRGVEVELLPGTAPELRKRAYSLDLGCLAKLYGCNARSDFIPAGF